MSTQDNHMQNNEVSHADLQDNQMDIIDSKENETKQLKSKITDGFKAVHQEYRPMCKWKTLWGFGLLMALIGVVETFREKDSKWYAMPVSLGAIATLGYTAKLLDKKDLLKQENDVLHKALDYPSDKKESAYHSRFVKALEKMPNPSNAAKNFKDNMNEEKEDKFERRLGCFVVFGLNAATTYAFSSLPLSLFCIGATLAVGESIVYRKHIQNRKILRATLPQDIQIPQMNKRVR